jgi:Ca2+-dependent lipid-binding protein
MISKTLEPVFEETAVLLVDANAAKVGEKVTLEVWDSDRFTEDDYIGRVEVDVAGRQIILRRSLECSFRLQS